MKKNTIIAQLARTGSRWQFEFLKSIGLKPFHEPTGGWPPNKFDTPLSWNHYLTTRMSCNPNNFLDNFENDPKKEKYNISMAQKFYGNDLRDVIEKSEYIEVGYASLPYIENVPCDWTLLGVVRHPQTWVHSACYHKFYYNHISWKPESLEDYAKVWVHYNKLILKHCERVFRVEDFDSKPEILAQQFKYFKKTNPKINYSNGKNFRNLPSNRYNDFINQKDFNWWEIVADLADDLGYEKLEPNLLCDTEIIDGKSCRKSHI